MRWLLIFAFCEAIIGSENAREVRSYPEISYFQLTPKVNVSNGEHVEEECDLIVAGCHPLSFRRFYGSNTNFHGSHGRWRFNPEHFCVANFDCNQVEKFIAIGDFNGSITACQKRSEGVCGFNKEKNGNYIHMQSTGQKHPANTHVSYHRTDEHKKWGHFGDPSFRYKGEINDGTGARRLFHSADFDWLSEHTLYRRPIQKEDPYVVPPQAWSPYQLPIHEERLPNGNFLNYKYEFLEDECYPPVINLKQIIAYNNDKTKTLGWLNFNYVDHRIFVTGSDGRKVELQYSSKHPGKQLEKVITLNQPEICYKYPGFGVNRVEKPEGRVFQTNYRKNSSGVDSQWAPLGPNGEMVPCYRYDYKAGATHVLDGEDNRTIYFFDAKRKIAAIQFFDGPIGYRKEVFISDPNTCNLSLKLVQDDEGTVFRREEYAYDKNQNVIVEKKGDDKSNYSLYRTYSDDGFNLLLREWDDYGKDVRYSYVSGTNLCSSELVFDGEHIRKRTFHFYDDCAIEIKTIVDDGQSENFNDLTAVTCRSIRICTPRYELPCFGLIKEAEEKTIDEKGREVLLAKVIYTYTPFGKVEREEHYDALGVLRFTIHNTYDFRERLRSTTDPLGRKTSFAYDQNNNLFEIWGDPATAQLKRVLYNKANLPVKIEELQSDHSMLSVNMAYDKCGRLTEKVDECGQKTTYLYDGLGRILQEWRPDGTHETKAYDILDNVIVFCDAKGEITQKDYDFQGNVVHIIHSDGCEEFFGYLPNSTLEWHIDRNGAKNVYKYDVFKHVVEHCIYGADGTLLKKTSATWSADHQLSSTDPSGLTTFFRYDFAGRKVAEVTGARKIYYEYDSLGRLWKTHAYDVTTVNEYDLLNRVVRTFVETKDGALIKSEAYEYDAAGNKTKVITSKGVKETVFNTRGQPILQRDPMGNETRILYAYKGCFVKTAIDSKGIQTISTHDAKGQVTEVVNQNERQEILQKIVRHFDPNGNLDREEIDVFIGKVLNSKIVHTWKFENGNRLKSRCEAQIKETHYEYDAKGRLETVIKPDGVKLYHEYDDLGRLCRYYSHDFDYRYSYDTSNRVKCVEDGVARTKTIRKYDDYGYLALEIDGNGKQMIYKHDVWGRRESLILHDGTCIDYAYEGQDLYEVRRKGEKVVYKKRDLDGEITSILLPGGLGELKIARDALGRWQEASSPYYAAHFSKEAYDSVGNLVRYTFKDGLGMGVEEYHYDALNQLIAENAHRYSFDSLYNRRQKDDSTYQVNELCQIVHDGKRDYTYDANGNLKSDCVSTFEYDSQDRLIGVKRGNCKSIYIYDCFHRRLGKKLFVDERLKETISYIWDGNNEIGAIDGSGAISELRVLGAGLGAEIGAAVIYELSGKAYVPLHDHRGAVITLVDLKTKKAVETNRYTAFGEMLEGGEISPWKFASKRFDRESGFLFFGRRYYYPEMGRWITADPQGFKNGPNLYAYVHNGPLNAYDLYGLYDVSFARTRNVADFMMRCGRTVFSAIEFCGRHMIPVAGARDFVEAVGRWGSGGQFFAQAEYRKNYNRIFTIEGKEAGKQNVDHNGANISFEEACRQGKELSKLNGGAKVDLLYNASQGFMTDMIACLLAKFGIYSSYERMCAHYYKSKLEENPNLQFITYVHSQAATHLMNTGKTLNSGERGHIDVKAFGPATLIPRGYFGRAQNFISKLDVVPWTGLGMLGGNHDITFLSPSSYNPLEEHSFMGETYGKILQDLGQQFSQRHFDE